MDSTRRRWRVFRPWIEKPCSRVLRKLSGELTTIQNWLALASARPPFRRRRPRPALPAGPAAPGSCSASSSATAEIVAVCHRSQLLRLGQQGCEVSDLDDVGHLVPAHAAADV